MIYLFEYGFGLIFCTRSHQSMNCQNISWLWCKYTLFGNPYRHYFFPWHLKSQIYLIEIWRIIFDSSLSFRTHKWWLIESLCWFMSLDRGFCLHGLVAILTTRGEKGSSVNILRKGHLLVKSYQAKYFATWFFLQILTIFSLLKLNLLLFMTCFFTAKDMSW